MVIHSLRSGGLSFQLSIYIRLIGCVSVFCLLAVILYAIFPVSIKPATSLAADAPVTSETVLTMDMSQADVNLDLTVRSGAGTFATSDDTDMLKFDVTTNNYTGYAVYFSTDDEDASLINTDTGASLVSIETATSADDFSDDANTNYNGKWGYMANIYNVDTETYDSLSNNNYLSGPTDSRIAAINTTDCANNTTDCPDNKDAYAIALGGRVDYTYPVGTYTNTFVLNAISNVVAYTINYTDGTGDTSVVGLPVQQTSSSSTGDITSVALSPDFATPPERTGYTFANKWCDGTVNTSGDETGTTCDGKEYNAGDIWYLDQTTNNVLTLYAMWTPNNYDITIKTADGISSVSLNGVSCESSSGCVVPDLIYGHSYELTATGETGYGLGSWDTGGYGEVDDLYSSETTYTVGAGDTTITPTPKLNTWSLAIVFGEGVSSVQVRTGADNTGTLMGTITNSGDTVSNLQYNTAYYLLPTYASDYYTLDNWGNTGSYGTLSSTSDDNPYFVMGDGDGEVTLTESFSYGECTSASTCMQFYTKSMCAADATSSPITLTDARDGHQYTARYVNGNCWMTKNLSIGCNGSSTAMRTLTSAGSNVANNWSTPTKALSAGDSYTDPRMTCDATYGAWYNYKAASAGTISGNSNSTTDTYNICPSGWTMPTKSQFSGVTGQKAALGVHTGGMWMMGKKGNTSQGIWWARDLFNSGSPSYRTALRYDANGSFFVSYVSRDYGIWVRCIATKSQLKIS